MLTDEDIQKLIGVFVTKEDLKEAVSSLSVKEDFNNLQSTVNAYAKKADILDLLHNNLSTAIAKLWL